MRIDSHQHYWQLSSAWHQWPTPDLAPIHRDFLPVDLAPALRRNGVDRTVLAQSQPSDADTQWLLALAAETDSIGAVVGWADFKHPAAREQIGGLAQDPHLRGLRPMLQDLAPDWILDPAAAPALEAMVAHGLVFDALIRPAHMAAIAELARRHSDLQIVVDHAAKPDIASGIRQPMWEDGMAALAACPNVSCKLSGLVTEAGTDWTCNDLTGFSAHLIASFGPDRLLWGSDWPVVLLAAEYDDWLEAAHTLLKDLSPAEQDQVLGLNAARLYRIG